MEYKFKDIVSNCCERIDPSESDSIPYVGLEHIGADTFNIQTYGKSTDVKGQKFIMKKGDVLFGRRRAYQRKVAIAPFDGIFSAHGMIFRPKQVIDESLLPFFIRSDAFMNKAISLSVGSLSPTLNWGAIKDITFSIPSKEIQPELSSLLWKIEDDIERLKEQIQSLDILVKSRFIEMFGGCKEKVPIGNICTLHSRIGWQALTKVEHMSSGDYMLITGTDFKDGQIDYSGSKFVSKERYEMDPNIIIQNGDVLVTKDGTIGKVAVVRDLPKPATLNAGIFVVRNRDDQFLTEFLQQCLLSTDFQRFIESVKRGATIVHLNQEKFLKYEIPVADPELQKQFVSFVQQVDKSKFELQKHLDDTKRLQKALINQAFDPKSVQN